MLRPNFGVEASSQRNLFSHDDIEEGPGSPWMTEGGISISLAKPSYYVKKNKIYTTTQKDWMEVKMN